MADQEPTEQTVVVTTLLNCWRREVDPGEVLSEALVVLPLHRLGVEVVADVTYSSATGRHAYCLPARLRARGAPVPLEATTLATLLGQELALRGEGPAALAGFVAAVIDSAANLTRFLKGPYGIPAALPFLRAEQSLRAGHPLHPTAKGRQPLTVVERDATAPELRAAFPLHWFRADRAVVAEDTAHSQAASTLLADLLARDPGVDPALPLAQWRARGDALVPLHPVQAQRLRESLAVRTLLEEGALTDLGAQGAPWRPTSSVRTVARDDVGFMLKLSLDVRVTNSVRRNLRKELARGVEVARLLDAGLGAAIAARFPRFGIIRDPGWITVETGEAGESGFETVVREQPYGPGNDATVVAALGEPAGDGGPPPLVAVVRRLAEEDGRPVDELAREWFRRYLRVVADPLLWLATEWGVALEAHQQNSVVELEGGWPAGFRYRDNQGYYFKRSAEPRLRALLPDLNAASDTICEDAVADERFAYYLGVNHLLGLVGTFGVLGLADERDLLADLGAAVPLFDTEHLRVKANLRTRLADMDELAGPLAAQSVYVDWPNPVAAVRAGVGR